VERRSGNGHGGRGEEGRGWTRGWERGRGGVGAGGKCVYTPAKGHAGLYAA